ncbi:MAG: UdgX family uracil-DNA binding protein [Rhodospirillales bacterium]|nr:UdgX family uracil-DNA binding protein [Rhodospirillales bacterium]
MQVVLTRETDWEGWRRATRALVLTGVAPEKITWRIGRVPAPLPEAQGTFNVPRNLVEIAALAFQAHARDRFDRLYRLVWRAHHGALPAAPQDDPALAEAQALAFAVRAEAHRMRTHMRFMPVEDADGPRFLGWYAPQHHVLEANAQLLARRFPDKRWSILTPEGSAHWDGGGHAALRFGPGARGIVDDATLATWWDAHHAALLQEAVPGSSVPEAEALDEAPRPPDLPPLGPVVLDLAPDPAVHRAAVEAGQCRRCDLWQPASQTVFGEGPAGAQVVFIGEQPGDQEDVIGRPFVGPAGQLLDRAMEEAGIDRRTIYITNAVKHFKFTPRGKRRIHQSPDATEIQVCRFWLDVERVQLAPRLLVLMGASGARAVLGRPVTVTRERGRPFALEDGQTAFITVHPSYLLRIPDPAGKAREYRAFVEDLRRVRALMEPA